MRLLLLHLSDIHIRTGNDWILSRASRISDAVRDVEHQLDLCIVALTGDVAFSGLPEQYALAERWLHSLVEALAAAERGRVPIHVVAIPGNHDVDLRQPAPARESLIESMLKDPRIAADPAAAIACVPPQAAFFDFRDRVASDGLVSDGRVYYEYNFDTETSPAEGSDNSARTALRIRCLNTAWVSQNPEVPAKLIYPEALIPQDSSSADDSAIVITMLHHPYNWLEPMNARAVRQAVQTVSDVILTGHEHAPGVRHQQDEAGGEALYIEGVALQGHGSTPPESEFHAIFVDTERHERRIVSFHWEGSRYEADRSPVSAWAPFAANPLRDGHRFQVSRQMREKLSDAGLVLSHPSRGRLTLDDIFVYPDLTEVRYAPGKGQGRLVRGEDALSLARETGRLLITGTDDSGKTSLAKRLFLDSLANGAVPVLLSGATVRLRGDDRDRNELASQFEDQYDARGAEYLDIPPSERVVILDDFTSMKAGDRPRAEVLEYLTHFADTVILFAHDVAQQVLEIAGHNPIARGRTPFAHYRILPVSHVRREEMIGRYVSLAGNGDHAKDEHLRTEMRRTLALALGKYYAPPVPVSVVSILQARAFNDQLNLNQSTYGYYYELLITRALLLHTTQQELDVRLAYLTDLAFAVFKAGKQAFSEEWLSTFHQEFIHERKLRMGFRDAVAVLIEAGMLHETADGFEFRYKYIYYYFASRALSIRIGTDDGRAYVERLTKNLDNQESANILLFLTHHSKDPAIIDPMLAHAESLFAEVERADLEPGSTDATALVEALRGAVYEDAPIEEKRQAYLAHLDAAERASGDHSLANEPTEPDPSDRDSEREAAVAESLGLVSRIYEAFRTMQILGQLLKNFPGTLSGLQKERITRAVYGVALRTLGAVRDLFRAAPEQHAASLIEILRQEHPDMSSGELLETARRALGWQLRAAAFGVTQRAAADVGTPLLDPVFDEVEGSDPVPAVRLISTAIRLDRAGRFPEERVKELARLFDGNPIAMGVLIGLVITHFHLFDVDRNAKQRICQLLGIDYRPPLPRSRRRLISSGS